MEGEFMPIEVFKGSLKYCLGNIKSFLLVFLSFFLFEISLFIFDDFFICLLIIAAVLISGYCIQVIEDVINGGTRLPEMKLKKMIVFGAKSLVIVGFYFIIQVSLLGIVALILNFPLFDLEELVLKPQHTLNMIYGHGLGSFIIFLILGFVIYYVTIFFMELSLAKLADGGQLRKSFNFSKIKRAIDIIGWKNYTVGYTKIIIVIIFLAYVNKIFTGFTGLALIVDSLTLLTTFIVESRGMGRVYKVYTDNKKNI